MVWVGITRMCVCGEKKIFLFVFVVVFLFEYILGIMIDSIIILKNRQSIFVVFFVFFFLFFWGLVDSFLFFFFFFSIHPFLFPSLCFCLFVCELNFLM